MKAEEVVGGWEKTPEVEYITGEEEEERVWEKEEGERTGGVREVERAVERW